MWSFLSMWDGSSQVVKSFHSLEPVIEQAFISHLQACRYPCFLSLRKLCVSRLNMLSIDPAWVPLHTCTSFLCSKSIEPVCLPLGWSWIWVGEGFLLSIWLTHSSSFLNLTTKLSIFGSRVELYFYWESCLISTLFSF